MSISAVNFAGNRANQYNPEEKKSNSTTKTIASAVLPGLGQVCDGRVGAGQHLWQVLPCAELVQEN